MVRAPFYDEHGVKKGAWSADEDNKLKAYVQKHGHCNWRELPRAAGLSRCGKSCRLRWINYLRPDVKRGNYSKEEEELILQLHQQHGNKWSLMATRLLGRTDNEIKNYWHTHLKKLKGSNKVTKKQQKEEENPIQKRESEMKISNLRNEQGIWSHQIFESSPLSSEISNVCSNQESTEDSPPSTTTLLKFEEPNNNNNNNNNNNGDFWGDLFVADNCELVESENLVYFDNVVIGGFNPSYDLGYDDDLFYQVLRELPHNYQPQLY